MWSRDAQLPWLSVLDSGAPLLEQSIGGGCHAAGCQPGLEEQPSGAGSPGFTSRPQGGEEHQQFMRVQPLGQIETNHCVGGCKSAGWKGFCFLIIIVWDPREGSWGPPAPQSWEIPQSYSCQEPVKKEDTTSVQGHSTYKQLPKLLPPAGH